MAEEPSRLEKLGGKLLRPSQRAGLEDLIASELALATVSPPLEKIRHACEALMLLEEGERKRAGITVEEVKEGERIYALASTFQNVFIDKYEDEYGEVIERSATISWPFPSREASSWLGWADEADCKFYVMDEVQRRRMDEIKKIGDALVRKYEASRERITIDTLNEFKIRFVVYAMPRAANLLKKIIRLVSPDSFTQALEMFKSRRAPSEKAEYRAGVG